MSLKVCKFGGTSLADGHNIRQVSEIIRSDSARRYIVVSAPGKRFSDDIKITDLLYQCYRESLETGRLAAVTALSAGGGQRRRLLELGFVPGGRVQAVQESPWGDPVAYAVCGAVIALRRADARQIAVRPLT